MTTLSTGVERSVSIPPTGHYEIDTVRSTVTFTTRHMFGLGKVHGRFAITTGQIIVAEPVSNSTGSAVIDASSFSTGNNSRDPIVRSAKFLDVERYPVVTFTAENPHESDGYWVLPGTVTVREVSRPIRLDIRQLTTSGDGLRAQATVRIDRTEMGITGSKGITGRYLDMVVDLVATRSE